jgi:hypothetical protein
LDRKRRNSSLEGAIEVIVSTWHILDPDVTSFTPDPWAGIGIFYLAIKFQTCNRCRVANWLTVIQQPIPEFNKHTVKEYILNVSEHEFSEFMSTVLFNLGVAKLSKVGNSQVF